VSWLGRLKVFFTPAETPVCSCPIPREQHTLTLRYAPDNRVAFTLDAAEAHRVIEELEHAMHDRLTLGDEPVVFRDTFGIPHRAHPNALNSAGIST